MYSWNLLLNMKFYSSVLNSSKTVFYLFLKLNFKF